MRTRSTQSATSLTFFVMIGLLKSVVIFCCLVITSANKDKTEGPMTIETVVGVHVQTLKEPLWYHSLVPILFEIPLPKWNISDITTIWPNGFGDACQDSDRFAENWTSMSCPVDYHLHSVIERAHENLLPWLNLLPLQNEKPSAPADFRCGEIHPHFNTHIMTDKMRENYIEDGIKTCHPREYVHVNMANSWKDVNQSVYNTMLNRFTEEFSNPAKYRISGYVKYATAINAHTIFQLAELLDFYETSEIFKNALITCSNYRLPYSLVKKRDLESALNEIMKIFYRKNFIFTLPVSDLDIYYKKQISDCILTTKNTLLIRVLVPLMKMDFPLEMVQLIPIPFIKTQKNTTKLCAYETSQKHFIRDDHLDHFFLTECLPNEFCKVPDIANRKVQRTCIHALLSMDPELASTYCGLNCDLISSEDLPVFQRIDDSTYAIAGSHTDVEIFVNCGTNPFKIVSPPENGAVIVELPCNCQLAFKAETLYSYGKCNNSLVVFTEIVPFDWTSPDEYFAQEMDKHARDVDESNKKYQNLKYYNNVNFTILSLIIVIIVVVNISLFYVVLGILQRMNRLHTTADMNGMFFLNTRTSVRRQILDLTNKDDEQ